MWAPDGKDKKLAAVYRWSLVPRAEYAASVVSVDDPTAATLPKVTALRHQLPLRNHLRQRLGTHHKLARTIPRPKQSNRTCTPGTGIKKMAQVGAGDVTAGGGCH